MLVLSAALARYLIVVGLIVIGNRLFTIRVFGFAFVLFMTCFWVNYVCRLVA